jgi:molecular chaperone DnaK
LAYQVEKQLQANANLSGGDRAPVETAIAKVREVANSEDVHAIRRAIDDLQKASQAMAQHMAGQRTQDAAGGARAGGGNGPHYGEPAGDSSDDVIDAEYEVKH